MRLNRKASLLFIISLALFFSLSLLLAFTKATENDDLLFFLNAVAVSLPAFFIPAVIFRRKTALPRFKAPPFGHIMLAVVLGIGCVNLNQALSLLNEAVFYGVEISSNSTTAETVMNMNFFNLVFSLAIIPPLSEEFLMRGALLESWRRYSPVGAMLITSILFALLHAAPSAFIVYFGLGLLLAAVYLITRNVWLTVVVHFVNNMSTVLSTQLLKVLYSSDEAKAILEGAVDGETVSRAGYFGLFLLYGAIAAAIIIPMLIALRAIYRRRGEGMFADTAAKEALDDPDAESVEILPDPAEEEKGSMWKDPLLWVAVGLLIIINVAAGLSEFGVFEGLL